MTVNGATVVTGYTDGLSQDYNRKLGKWFANRLGARQQLRQDFPMKKYIIDETLMKVITDYCLLRCETSIPDRLAVLKPIEPLSRGKIEAVWNKCWPNYVVGAVTVTFARAIERHIIGEIK